MKKLEIADVTRFINRIDEKAKKITEDALTENEKLLDLNNEENQKYFLINVGKTETSLEIRKEISDLIKDIVDEFSAND